MKRGWCPTVHEPMPTGDGLLARVKPFGGRLTGDAARFLARSARAHGNGIIELTGRGNLQVRGLASAVVGDFAGAMVGAGLAHPHPGAERRRNVLVSPLAGDDPEVAENTLPLARAIEKLLVDDAGLGFLPPKFCIAIDGGGVLPLGFQADITVRLTPHPHPGPLPRAGEKEASPLPPGGEGWVRGSRAVEAVGFKQYAGSIIGAFGIGLPFGQTDVETLSALASLAERWSDGVLRVTPWRALMLGSVRRDDAARITEAVAELGLITDPRDPRLRAFACIGSAGCGSGTVPARADAARLAAAGFEGTLHVSGCAKGCAHPGPATVTMVGEAGRYRILRDARANAA